MTDNYYHEAFKLVLISAWNDSGGGFTHRLFDGHPDFHSYPFEMQFGTTHLEDGFSEWFHKKYRWPFFNLPLPQLTAAEIFDAIIDQELKSTIRDQDSSKFHEYAIEIDEHEWLSTFELQYQSMPPNRRAVIIAYLSSFFSCWKNRVGSGDESMFLGHCPIINIDADLIFQDFPETRMIHVVRSPLSGFSDMRFRRPEVNLESYCKKWNVVNSMAIAYEKKYPSRFKCIRYIDLLTQRKTALKEICEWLKITFNDLLMEPTWNTQPISASNPFGGVRHATLDHEATYKTELTQQELSAINLNTEGIRSLLPGLLPSEQENKS